MSLFTQLARRQAIPMLLVAGLTIPTISKADGCDNITDLAVRWHTLSTYIDEHAARRGDLSQEQIKKVTNEYHTLTPPTKEFGRALTKIDNKQIQSLGKQTVAILEELENTKDADSWDDITTIMDRLVEVLDKVAEECSKG